MTSANDRANVHATAMVDPGATLGSGVVVWHWSHIREGAILGDGCRIGQGVYIDEGVTLGSGCKVQNAVSIYRGVSIGRNVFIGPHVTFTNDLTPRAHTEDWQVVPTVVDDGASVGANATIVCGVRLGRNCMVGAGAVVTKDVPAYGLVVGTPARLIDFVRADGSRLRQDPPVGPDAGDDGMRSDP